MRSFLFFTGLLCAAAADWRHGWDTSAAFTFADFWAPKTLSDAEVDFVVDKYRVISLEKCTGSGSGLKTEAAIYDTAARIKKKSPGTKVIFYLATDGGGGGCYAANSEFLQHPEWWLKDDAGQYVGGASHVPDVSVAAARDWWASLPLRGDGNGTYKGQLVSELIDGVLADGFGFPRDAGISLARRETLADGKEMMLAQLQDIFTKANGGIVMANGISMYGGSTVDPRTPGDHNLHVLNSVNGIMNEHTAVFESVDRNSGKLKFDLVASNLETIVNASKFDGGSKTVFVSTWPGLMSATDFWGGTVYPPVANGGEPSPRNYAEWREALRKHFTFAHALFLTIAESNIYWSYAGFWYKTDTGYLPCPHDLNSCAAPPEWYPDLEKPLGSPKGPRQEVAPNVWEREFEFASVHLDLNVPSASTVTFRTLSLGALAV